jgi:hypothetical protein
MPEGISLQNNGWGAHFAQTGNNISGSNYSWNANIPSGVTLGDIGFNISHNGQYNSLQAIKANMSVYLNGQLCQM